MENNFKDQTIIIPNNCSNILKLLVDCHFTKKNCEKLEIDLKTCVNENSKKFGDNIVIQKLHIKNRNLKQ